MKNIHLIQTDKPSRLHITGTLNLYPNGILGKSQGLCKNQHIYITNSEEIKEGDWVLNIEENKTFKPSNDEIYDIKNSEAKYHEYCKKIILTTNQDLIDDGVQAIDDEFLEWFVKNPSCEEVKLEYRYGFYAGKDLTHYKIIIPKEEPKPETIEEAAVNFVLKHFLFPNELFFKMSKCSQNDYLLEEEFGLDNTTKYREILGFIEGAKWQQEKMYSEEEVRNLFKKYQYDLAQWVLRMEDDIDNKLIPVEWFEQNKNK